MKTFGVTATLPDGSRVRIPATQLATFTHYINNIQYRFVVTEMPGCLPVVTHRASGMRVCEISLTTLAAARHDARGAGILALTGLIEAKGADRVASALQLAETRE